MTLPPPKYDDGFGTGSQVQYRFAWPPLTPMVKRLLIINLGLYGLVLLAYLADFWGPIRAFVGLGPGSWKSWFPLLPVWQLITYGFIHSPSPEHVLFNMLGLYFFGGMVERTVGATRFLSTYLVAILLGGAAFLVVGLVTGSDIPVVGASGGVLAMIVAAACFNPNATVILIMFPIPLKFLAGGIVALDFINGALSWKGGSDGTAHLVHVVGAVVGFVAVRKGFIWRDPIQAWQRKRAVAEGIKRQEEQQHMDELLGKIHREGMTSLTKREKDFLKRVSKRQ